MRNQEKHSEQQIESSDDHYYSLDSESVPASLDDIHRVQTRLATLEIAVENLKQHTEANTLQTDKQTQWLIRSTNEKLNSLSRYYGADNLMPILTAIVADVRQYCDELIPFTSGLYKGEPKKSAKQYGTYFAIKISEGLVHVFFSDGGVIEQLAKPLPFSGIVISLIKMYNERQLVLHAQKTVGFLRGYSGEQRNAIYHYVVAATLCSLKNVSSPRQLQNYQEPLLAYCLEALHVLHKVPNLSNSYQLATQWQNHVALDFTVLKDLQHEAGFIPGSPIVCYKPDPLNQGTLIRISLPVNSNAKGKEEMLEEESLQQQPHSAISLCQLQLTLKIQEIFNEEENLDSEEYQQKQDESLELELPVRFMNQFHQDLLTDVVNPYINLANYLYVYAFCHGYSWTEKQLLRKHLSRFVRALDIIGKDLEPLKTANPALYAEELVLINNCLYANLGLMCEDFSRKRLEKADALFIKFSRGNFVAIKTPLEINSHTAALIPRESVVNSLMVAHQRIDVLNKILQEKEEEAIIQAQRIDRDEQKLAKLQEQLDKITRMEALNVSINEESSTSGSALQTNSLFNHKVEKREELIAAIKYKTPTTNGM